MTRIIESMKEALERKCLELGFRKERFLFCRSGFKVGFNDIIFINYCDIGKDKSISVNALIQYPKIDEIYGQLANKRLTIPYIIISIYNIDPSFQHGYVWRFSKQSEITNIVNEFVELINVKFMAFYKEYENIERIIEVYEKGLMDKKDCFYILPLLYSIIGKNEKGIEVMESLQKYGIINDDQSRAFYTNYCQYKPTPIV